MNLRNEGERENPTITTKIIHDNSRLGTFMKTNPSGSDFNTSNFNLYEWTLLHQSKHHSPMLSFKKTSCSDFHFKRKLKSQFPEIQNM